MDFYALSKVVNEQTARAFALRSGFDIYALRIGNVIEPHEYELFPKWFPTGLPQEASCGATSTRAISARCAALPREGRARLSGLQRGNDDFSSDLPTRSC